MISFKQKVGFGIIIGVALLSLVTFATYANFYLGDSFNRTASATFYWKLNMYGVGLPIILIYVAGLNFLLGEHLNLNETKYNWILFGIAVLFLVGYMLLAMFVTNSETDFGSPILDVTFVRWSRIPLLMYLIGLPIYLNQKGIMVPKKLRVAVAINGTVFLIGTVMLIGFLGEITIFGIVYDQETMFRLTVVNQFVSQVITGTLTIFMLMIIGSIVFEELYQYSYFYKTVEDEREYKL